MKLEIVKIDKHGRETHRYRVIEDYEGILPDVDEVVVLNPNHFEPPDGPEEKEDIHYRLYRVWGRRWYLEENKVKIVVEGYGS